MELNPRREACGQTIRVIIPRRFRKKPGMFSFRDPDNAFVAGVMVGALMLGLILALLAALANSGWIS